jgi:hypothetical protein
MLRSPTAPGATLQKREGIMVKLVWAQLLLLLPEQHGEGTPAANGPRKPYWHRNLRLFKV